MVIDHSALKVIRLSRIFTMWRSNSGFEQSSGGNYLNFGRGGHRGRSQGRGWGHRGNRSFSSGWDGRFSTTDGPAGGVKREHNGVSRRGNERHPKHLRGKDIGLWYAKRSQDNQAKEVEQHINMDRTKAGEIADLLARMNDNVYPAAANWNATHCDSGHSSFQRQFMQHRLQSDVKEMGLNADPVRSSLSHDSHLDESLLRRHRYKETDPEYVKMLEGRKKLPSYDRREEIISAIKENQVVVISGETGCGKTTQVPQFILDDYIKSGKGSLCHIICTQPRRISAITVAERVADERIEKCGGDSSVGYQIRLETKLPRLQGSIKFCTTGMVLQFLKSDDGLRTASHLIMDEVHERDLDSDFLMVIVKDLLPTRTDLKLILMSATLNAEKFSRYFGGCKMLNIPGFTYPVKEYYLEDVIQMTRFQVSERCRSRAQNGKYGHRQRVVDKVSHLLQEQPNYEEDRGAFLRSLQSKYSAQTIETLKHLDEDVLNLDIIHSLLRHICETTQDGAILVFLTGWEEISNLKRKLDDDARFSKSGHIILPLHSMMPTVNQREIFERPPLGVRKIILATNIAETSITIDDVVYVVDSGKIKLTRLDLQTNVATIKAEWVSLANAKQRRGRAGRVQPGICYHLYTKHREGILESYQLPAILRERLESVCLKIKMLKLGKIDLYLSKALDAPSTVSVALAVKLLVTLNALDANENLTPLGYHLARLPLDPKMGKMILFGAMFSCLDPILTVAACLDFKDPFVIPLGKEKEVDRQKLVLSKGTNSDHIAAIESFKGWESARKFRNDYRFCRENFLAINTLKLIERMKGQLARNLQEVKFLESDDPKEENANRNSNNLKLVRAVICAGLYPNVAKMILKRKAGSLTSKPAGIRTKEDGRVSLHPKSVNCHATQFESPWLVYHMKLKSTGIFLHDTTCVPAYPLIFFGGTVRSSSEGAKDIVSVDDEFIKFQCNPQTAKLFLDLRSQLSDLLDYKITHPGFTSWNADEREGAIMNAIVELITSEEVLMEEIDSGEATN